LRFGSILAVLFFGLACSVLAGSVCEPIDILFTEVSIYSLPHIVVNHGFKVAEGETVICNAPNPQLGIRFKTVDHSHGTNVDARMDILIEEDKNFPYHDQEQWVPIHEFNRVTSNVQEDIRRSKEKLFSAAGEKVGEIALSYANPVKRIRVHAHAKLFNPVTSVLIRKPLSTAESVECRTFFLAMRPRWGGYYHQGTSMVQILRSLIILKHDFLRWRDYMVRLRMANRSLKDAREYSPDDLARVLKVPLKPRDDVDGIVSDFLNDSSRALGRPPERLDSLRKDVLGVERLSFSYPSIHSSLGDRTLGLVRDAGPLRNIIVTGGRLIEEGSVDAHVDRVLSNIDRQLKALMYLWGTADQSEFKSLLAAWERTLKAGVTELARLVDMLDGTLGRNSATGGWRLIDHSRLYRELFPREAASDAAKACQVLRGVFSDLLYLSLEARFATEVLDAAAVTVLTKVAGDQGLAGLMPEPDLAFPRGLWIDARNTTRTIRPGEVAQFSVQIENRSEAEREVRIEERPVPPSGWHSKLSQESVRLRPGESEVVHFTLGAPYYAHVPINHVSTLAIGWADEPGVVHQPQYLTRLTVGGKLAPLPGPVARRPGEQGLAATDFGATVVGGQPGAPPGDGLLVSTRQKERLSIEPGSVGRYFVTVIHRGTSSRSVSMKLMTPVPQRWLVDLKPEEAILEPGVPTRFAMRITAPVDIVHARTVELLLGIGYTDEFNRVDKLAFRTVAVELAVVRPRPLINSGEIRTYYAKRDAATTLMVELSNLGSVDDTFDLFVDEKPKDWYVHLDRTYIRLLHHRQPEALPITVRPPLGVLTGEFEKIALRAVSTTHPEVCTRQILTVAARADHNFALEPVHKQYLISPGTNGVLEFVARNVMDRAEKFAFKVSPETVHPEWVHLDEPIAVLQPEEERRLKVRVELPHDVPLDRRFPVVIMALDEHGGEIVSCRTDLVVNPNHRVRMVALKDRVVRTRTLLMVPLEITNLGSKDESIGLIIQGKRRYWARLSHRKVFLRPGAKYVVTLTVRVPVEIQYGQTADLTVCATSLKDGAARDFVRVNIDPPHMIRTNASTSGRETRF